MPSVVGVCGFVAFHVAALVVPLGTIAPDVQVIPEALPERIVDRPTIVREVALPPVGVSDPVALVAGAGVLAAVTVRCKFHVDY